MGFTGQDSQSNLLNTSESHVSKHQQLGWKPLIGTHGTAYNDGGVDIFRIVIEDGLAPYL